MNFSPLGSHSRGWTHFLFFFFGSFFLGALLEEGVWFFSREAWCLLSLAILDLSLWDFFFTCFLVFFKLSLGLLSVLFLSF